MRQRQELKSGSSWAEIEEAFAWGLEFASELSKQWGKGKAGEEGLG